MIPGRDSLPLTKRAFAQTMPDMLTRLGREIWAYRELLWILIGRTLKIRYKRSALGFLWTLLNPLFLITVYAVFLRILRFYDGSDPLFLPRLVTGILVWQFLAMCLGDSLHAILGNVNLVTKTAFPRLILPLSMVLANLINFLLSLIVLAIYALVVRLDIGAWWGLPAIVLTQTALCLGLSLFLSALNVLFRDTEHLLGVVLLAWFFLTPVIYSAELIPVAFQRLAYLNPMTGLVTAYRCVFMSAPPPSAALLGMSAAVAWASLGLGGWFFQRMQTRLVDEL